MLEKKGLVKLVEECGELIQIASKKMTRMDSDEHWDGQGSIQFRLESEIADVMAACNIVIENFGLNTERINQRTYDKYKLFQGWMNEDTDNCPGCGKESCFDHCHICGQGDCQSDHK